MFGTGEIIVPCSFRIGDKRIFKYALKTALRRVAKSIKIANLEKQHRFITYRECQICGLIRPIIFIKHSGSCLIQHMKA